MQYVATLQSSPSAAQEELKVASMTENSPLLMQKLPLQRGWFQEQRSTL
jgi:hypothetical protein